MNKGTNGCMYNCGDSCTGECMKPTDDDMNNLDKLIQEAEDHLKHYEETKESLLSDPEIPEKIKEIHIGLGEALKPTLKLLYEQKAKNEQPR